jgi:hypothetical protein
MGIWFVDIPGIGGRPPGAWDIPGRPPPMEGNRGAPGCIPG